MFKIISFIFSTNKQLYKKEENIIHPYSHKSDIYKDQTCIYRHFFVTNHERYNPIMTFVFSDLFEEAKTNTSSSISMISFSLTLSINLLAN